MLRETEWMTLNHILLDMYTVNSIEVLTKKVLKAIRLLIFYSKGYFILFDEDQQMIQDSLGSVGFDEASLRQYIGGEYADDYLKYLYDSATDMPIYQDTNVLMDNIRKFTPFYQNFLEPSSCFYGAGLLLIRNNRISGILELFRGSDIADFNEKDVYVLNVLKAHIENIIFNVVQMSRKQAMTEKSMKSMKERYDLTDREYEILKLLNNGCSNKEICDKLVISPSTVKKHIYNIYSKMGVKSRAQLINLIYAL